MTRTTVLQEVRQIRYEELYTRRQQRELTMAEAAEILGVTERTFRRWSTRYEADGVAGLKDRRLGRASARAVPVDDALQMVTLYERRYTGWTVTQFHERWQAEHGHAVLYLDQAPAPSDGPCRPSPSAGGTSEETSAQTLAGDDAPPGRLPA